MEINPNENPQRNLPVTVGDWILTMLIMVIPLVNLIMLLVWSFSGSTKISKANWAKASLVWMLIGIVVMIFFGGTILASLAAMSAAGY
jgi:hypothetical protein